jgi:hypothetical protein
MQERFLSALHAKVAGDSRFKAAWLEGSLGRGAGDRYSDLDIHLLIAESQIEIIRQEIENWLAAIRPLVLFNLLFDGRMVNALTIDGLRLDVWLHPGDSITIDPGKAKVLHQQPGAVAMADLNKPKDPAATANALLRQIKEFWRCISLTPAVIGRRELIVSVMGLGVEINLLSELLVNGYDVIRDTGVKNLNPYLPAETQRQIEHALDMHGLTPQSLADAHLGLARIVQVQGRIIAERHGFPYPAALEKAVLDYIQREFQQLDLHYGASMQKETNA